MLFCVCFVSCCLVRHIVLSFHPVIPLGFIVSPVLSAVALCWCCPLCPVLSRGCLSVHLTTPLPVPPVSRPCSSSVPPASASVQSPTEPSIPVAVTGPRRLYPCTSLLPPPPPPSPDRPPLLTTTATMFIWLIESAAGPPAIAVLVLSLSLASCGWGGGGAGEGSGVKK